MKQRVVMIILVVGVGIFLGLAILRVHVHNPALKAIFQQQVATLQIQKRIENKLNSRNPNADVSEFLVKQKSLELRITNLEAVISGLQKAVKKSLQPVRRGPSPQDFLKVYDIPIGQTTVIGKKDAPVTIVEFVDFQCPFCSRFHKLMVEAVKQFPDKVNYMIKNFPLDFHKQANPSAKAVLAAGEQGKYSEMADKLFENVKSLSEENYKKWANELGLDVDQFIKDYKEQDKKWEEIINKDTELGGGIGVRGTPTFYINGRKTRARDVAGFKKEIEKILEEKKK